METYRGKLQENFFRKWFFVNETDVKDVTVQVLNEDGKKIVISSTKYYIPWWLGSNVSSVPETSPHSSFIHDLTIASDHVGRTFPIDVDSSAASDITISPTLMNNMDELSKESENICSALGDLTIGSDQFGQTFLLESSDRVELSKVVGSLQMRSHGDISWRNSAPKQNLTIASQEINLETAGIALSSEKSPQFESTNLTVSDFLCDSEYDEYQHFISNCKKLKCFVEYALDIDRYYKERKEREQEIQILFHDAVLKTERERLNLDKKGEKNQRYVNLMKRLSSNSKEVSDEAVAARKKYNHAAKFYNDSIKKLKDLSVTTELEKAFVQMMCVKNVANEIKIQQMSIFETPKDLYDSEKYKRIINNVLNDE